MIRIEQFLSLYVIMTKEKKTFQQLTSENICEIYKLLLSEGLVSFPITPEAENKVDALVANVTGSSFGAQHYETTEEKVVAYLFFIIKAHAFTDGNKRTAVLSFLVLCKMNELVLILDNYGLDALAVYLEQLELPDHQKIIKSVSQLIFDE